MFRFDIFNSSLKFITCLALLALPISCGGGHHHDFVGAAIVSISASPRTIDTGDRTSVKINLSEVHKDGILLKIYYPQNFVYVPSSTIFKVDKNEYYIEPAFDVDSAEYVKSGHYLVFFFSKNDMGKGNYGELSFELVGKFAINDAQIGVDPDTNNLEIDDEVEFDPAYPEYEAEAYVTVTVRDR